MKILKFLLAALAASVLLSACKDSPGSAGATKAAVAPVSIEAIQAEAKGFTVGSTMSARTVYVFFDPQCPHCAMLWEAAKPLRSQAKFVWIPVGLMNKASTSQGATLLAAPDPVAAMDQHEASILAKSGGISASSEAEKQHKASIESNTALMNRFGFSSIPTIVTRNAQSGAVVTQEGSMPTAQLAAFLGVPIPGQ